MKRIKAMNGYTIMEYTKRDSDLHTIGEFAIYFSSDIRDYGVQYSTAEFEDIETLEIAEELCCGNYAIAKEMCEQESTAVTFEEIEKVEKMLDAGMTEEEIEEAQEQEYTSSSTSINSTKLPMIYGKIIFSEGQKVLDYGCGRYISHIKSRVEAQGATYIPYDKYNLEGSSLPTEVADIAICSNVLNVIKEDAIVKSIIVDLSSHSKVAYITTYEGDGSGRGKATGKDSYQRNQKTSEYIDMIRAMGYRATLKNKIIKIVF